MSTSPAATRRNLTAWYAGTRGVVPSQAAALPTVAGCAALVQLVGPCGERPNERVEPLFAELVSEIGAVWLGIPAPGPRVIPAGDHAAPKLPRTGPVLLAAVTEVPA